MERKDIVAFIVLSLLAALYYAALSNPFDSRPDLSTLLDDHDLAWCERIYHRNVDCPKYGEIEVPKEALAQEDVQKRRSTLLDDHDLAWCERIYHRNVICPKHGEIEVPKEVLAQEEVQKRGWCQSINYRNPFCDSIKDADHRRMCKSIDYEDPSCEKLKVGPDRLRWCESIYHRNVACPMYGAIEVPMEVLAQEEAWDRD